MDAILNLAEFSDDTLIKNLAFNVLEIQLKYLIKAVNNKGTLTQQLNFSLFNVSCFLFKYIQYHRFIYLFYYL